VQDHRPLRVVGSAAAPLEPTYLLIDKLGEVAYLQTKVEG